MLINLVSTSHRKLVSMEGRDLESSTPLLRHEPSSPKRKVITTLLSSTVAAALLLSLTILLNTEHETDHRPPDVSFPMSRGVFEGVSEKSTASLIGSAARFPWTDAMLQWQRTGFHFQPEKNWMNDPDGPMFYKGWYHIFYQYNPGSAVWGNITWGHAVSRDLIHWFYLPIAFVPDQWYDANGAMTGSATFLPDGRIAMLYTGITNEFVQVQNQVYPEDIDDPLLLRWFKSDANPILVPPPGIGPTDFRDPSTAWSSMCIE